MGIDPFSPLAPARVRVLVLPCGKITSRRFNAFVESLQQVSSVRLGDITPDARDQKGTFSPLAFPDGRVHLDISCAAAPVAYGPLASFEPFRGTMIIIGAIDASQYEILSGSEDSEDDGGRKIFYRRAHDGFMSTMENAQDQYTGTLLTQFLTMDCVTKEKQSWIPEGALHLAPGEAADVANAMCNVVGRFIHELAGWAEQIKTRSSIPTPITAASYSQHSEGDRTASLRMSDPNQGSRDGSAGSGSIPRPHSRHLSQTFRSPSPTITDSPRPDSPSSRSETPSSPDRSSVTDSPVGPEEHKQRQRFSRNIITPTSNPDKERNIGKARIGIMIGTLHMMAGQWSTAWRELIEHTSKSRSLHDYIWLAFGIERLTICMLLLGSEGFGFQIPSICSSSERQTSIPFIDTGRDSSNTIGAKDSENARSCLRKLGSSLSDINSTIMTYFDRAGSYGEDLAPLVFSEFVLRVTKLHSCLLAGVDSLASDPVFSNGQLDSLCRTSNTTGPPEASRSTICENLFRAFPQANGDLDIANKTMILGGMLSVLSTLGLERKRAIVMKELVIALTAPLQQARKLGAAELGIHPSSNLSYAGSLPSNSNQGDVSIKGLLTQLHSAYAIREPVDQPLTGSTSEASAAYKTSHGDFERLIDETTNHLARLANLDHMGSHNLKFDILRTGIDFCEAIPDPSGAAVNAALLLSISGPQRPIDPTRRERYVTLAVEEQVRLANVIASVATLAGDSEVHTGLAPFWDKFLVRSVQLAEVDVMGRLTEHRKADMETDGTKTLFLYDPFAKTADNTRKDSIVVAGERAFWAVVLQNPYDFEINIETISFVLEGGELAVEPAGVILGPRRLQEIIVAATPSQPGTLKILACRVKVAGCKGDVFAIYNDEWHAETHVRVKEAVKPSILSKAVDRSLTGQWHTPLKSSSVEIVAIAPQPAVMVESVDLKNHSLMLLEGERASFNITIRNVSDSVDVDFLHISFEDSLTNALRTSLSSKTISRAELYHIEFELAQNPIFTWKRLDLEDSSFIQAGTSARFEIGVLGRSGIRDARVFFDFAHAGGEQGMSRFYTRQLAVNVNISVNACIELQHFDVVRLPRVLGDDTNTKQPNGQCLLLFDVRSVWPRPIDFEIHSGQAQTKAILPMQTVRFALPLQRLHVKDPQAQIPWISPQSRRQFVVSNTEDAGQQQSVREQFWYREELFKFVSCSWQDRNAERHGSFSLRGIRLTAQQLAALRTDDLDIHCSIMAQSDHFTVTQTGGASFEVQSREFLSFQVRLSNRSNKGIHAMLRMLPMVANQGSEAGPDTVSRRLVWSGVLQRPVPIIEPGQGRTVELGFCALSAGMYSIGVVVEEVRPALARERAGNDEDLEEAVKQTEERRVWRAPDLCSIRAI